MTNNHFGHFWFPAVVKCNLFLHDAQRTMLNKCYEVHRKFLIRNTFDRLDNKLLQLISPASFIGSNVAGNDGVGGR